MKKNCPIITNYDLGILIVRLTVGILLLLHGIAKITHGVSGIAGMLSAQGLPGFLAYGVYVGEVVAPLMIIVGWNTRLASLIVLINMLVALFTAHAGDIFSMSPHGGWAVELIGFYIFTSLALFFTGDGKYSIAGLRK